ncbi:MAG: RNA methyltransferase, partial [Acaryochloridaceae cyanobacterium RL_2_7]|nr:RNA methyltransferase [Acaryochloridaceae cyanobacterium RL_2_7]
ADLQLEWVSDEVMDAMATTKNPDGVVAIAPWPRVDQVPTEFQGMGLVLESIQDPGNLGTILRSTSAAQGTGLFLSSDCVALTNPKVLRASVGAWFRVPTFQPPDLKTALQNYQSQGVQLVATTPTATEPYWSVDYQKPTLILIGNEGAGLSAELLAIADLDVTIPIDGYTESLNAAIAASIILFEGRRQRLIT